MTETKSSQALEHTVEIADWAQVARLVRGNRLWTAAARALGAEAATPGWFAARASAAVRKANLLNLRVLNTAARVVPVLRAAGVDVLVVKGPLLQKRLFGSPFVRGSTDLDLLVPPAQTARAAVVLAQLGYALPTACDSLWWRHFLGEQHFLSADPALCEIDLHHKLRQAGCPGPRRLSKFFAEAEIEMIGGAAVPVLSPVHAWLLSCISLVKGLHQREPAGHYAVEVAQAVNSASESERARMLLVAREQGLLKTALLATGAAENVLGISLPLARGTRRAIGIDDREALGAILGASDDTHWTRRRLVWAWSEGQSAIGRFASFSKEGAWMVSGEMCRRLGQLNIRQGARASAVPVDSAGPVVQLNDRTN